MSPIQIFKLAMVTFVAVGFGIGIALVETQIKALFFVFFGWGIAGSYLVFLVKCPACGTSITYKGQVLGLPFYAGYASRECRNCGFDLTQPLGKK
jgi:hypothetical protein